MKESTDTIKIVRDTANKLGIDPGPVSMMAFMGANPDTIIKTIVNQVNVKETEKAEKENPVNSKPLNYTEIESFIHDMMIENTGTHLLDSGGAYGRAWEKNRHINDFRTDHPLKMDIDGDWIEASLDVFTYLTEQLDRDQECVDIEKQYYQYVRDNDLYIGYSSIEPFLTDILGIDAHSMHSINTYNGESILSQVLQFTIWDYNFVFLQIHGGCDVRGGYTDPKLFKLSGFGDWLSNDLDISASCDCVEVYTDDSYHWFINRDNRKEPTQTQLNGDLLELEPVIVDHKIPKFWMREPNTRENPQYTGNHQLRCKYCNKIVNFQGCV